MDGTLVARAVHLTCGSHGPHTAAPPGLVSSARRKLELSDLDHEHAQGVVAEELVANIVVLLQDFVAGGPPKPCDKSNV